MLSEQRDFNPTQQKNQQSTKVCERLELLGQSEVSHLTAQEVGEVVLKAATFAAQAHLFTRRAANSTLAYTQRKTLQSLAEVLNAAVSPLTRIGRALASHEATRSREAEPEVPQSECCTAGIVQ